MQNIILIYGGATVEHDISIITALQCEKALRCTYDNVTKVYIAKDNTMYLADKLTEPEHYKHIDTASLKRVLFFDGGLYIKRLGGYKKYKDVYCVVNCCHGGIGENGELVAMLKTQNIPCTSANCLPSAICMNKHFTKMLLKSIDIPTVNGVLVTRHQYHHDKECTLAHIKDTLTHDVIVKPNSLGSSIGISKCSVDDISASLDLVFTMDDCALVEDFIQNKKEVNCAVLLDGDDLVCGELEEPVNKDAILDFEKKYIHHGKGSKGMKGSDRIIPANISDEMRDEIIDYSRRAYQFLGLSGVVRIDYLIDIDHDKVYLNEINTIPGSLAFFLYERKGIDYPTMLSKMIETKIHSQSDLITYFDGGVIK